MAHHSVYFGKNICLTECKNVFVKRWSSQLKNITYKEILEEFKKNFLMIIFCPKILAISISTLPNGLCKIYFFH